MNNMQWNESKFQILRVGNNTALEEETILFTPNYIEVIDVKDIVKDLGVLVDDRFFYDMQILK